MKLSSLAFQLYRAFEQVKQIFFFKDRQFENKIKQTKKGLLKLQICFERNVNLKKFIKPLISFFVSLYVCQGENASML